MKSEDTEALMVFLVCRTNSFLLMLIALLFRMVLNPIM